MGMGAVAFIGYAPATSASASATDGSPRRYLSETA